MLPARIVDYLLGILWVLFVVGPGVLIAIGITYMLIKYG